MQNKLLTGNPLGPYIKKKSDNKKAFRYSLKQLCSMFLRYNTTFQKFFYKNHPKMNGLVIYQFYS